MQFLHEISDTERSYCPKCHPYIAGCIVVVIILFTMYHANDIKTFAKTIFGTDSNQSDPSIAASKQYRQFNVSNLDDISTANAAMHFNTLSILLLTLTMLPTIAMSHLLY